MPRRRVHLSAATVSPFALLEPGSLLPSLPTYSHPSRRPSDWVQMEEKGTDSTMSVVLKIKYVSVPYSLPSGVCVDDSPTGHRYWATEREDGSFHLPSAST